MSSIRENVLKTIFSSLSDHRLFINNKISFPQASDKELIWVIRIGIFGVGAVATVLALTIKSIYSLWALCSDLVFVILFPQLLCAIYVPFVNTYGSLCAFVVGLILRFGGGEAVIGLKPFIKYPMYDEKLHRQMFPFRTLAMLVSLITLMVVSYLAKVVFLRCQLPPKMDVLKVFHEDHEESEEIELNSKPVYVLEEKEHNKRL